MHRCYKARLAQVKGEREACLSRLADAAVQMNSSNGVLGAWA